MLGLCEHFEVRRVVVGSVLVPVVNFLIGKQRAPQHPFRDQTVLGNRPLVIPDEDVPLVHLDLSAGNPHAAGRAILPHAPLLIAGNLKHDAALLTRSGEGRERPRLRLTGSLAALLLECCRRESPSACGTVLVGNRSPGLVGASPRTKGRLQAAVARERLPALRTCPRHLHGGIVGMRHCLSSYTGRVGRRAGGVDAPPGFLLPELYPVTGG